MAAGGCGHPCALIACPSPLPLIPCLLPTPLIRAPAGAGAHRARMERHRRRRSRSHSEDPEPAPYGVRGLGLPQRGGGGARARPGLTHPRTLWRQDHGRPERKDSDECENQHEHLPGARADGRDHGVGGARAPADADVVRRRRAHSGRALPLGRAADVRGALGLLQPGSVPHPADGDRADGPRAPVRGPHRRF